MRTAAFWLRPTSTSDEDNCLEVVIMKGRSGELKHLADHMLSMRGVKHGKLVLTANGKK